MGLTTEQAAIVYGCTVEEIEQAEREAASQAMVPLKDAIASALERIVQAWTRNG